MAGPKYGCTLGFDENGILKTERPKEKFQELGERIRIDNRDRPDLAFIYQDGGIGKPGERKGKPKALICLGYVPANGLPEELKEKFFYQDSTGKVCNLHGCWVCTGCYYFREE